MGTHPAYEMFLRNQLEQAERTILKLERIISENYFAGGQVRGIAHKAARRIFEENRRLRAQINEIEQCPLPKVLP